MSDKSAADPGREIEQAAERLAGLHCGGSDAVYQPTCASCRRLKSEIAAALRAERRRSEAETLLKLWRWTHELADSPKSLMAMLDRLADEARAVASASGEPE